MNTELFIARKFFSDKTTKKGISKPIINIAVFGIALGLAVMILSVAIMIGFKTEISNKVIGFGSHIQIVNYDSNQSFETIPIVKNNKLLEDINNLKGIKHVQQFATKAGIIKTKTDIQGIVLKGIGNKFDWSFFNKHLIKGKSFQINDTVKSNKILISKYISSTLNLDINDKIAIYFIQQPPRIRVFKIAGIYETSLAEFDEKFAIIDIAHIKNLNNWSKDQISGYEIELENFNNLTAMNSEIKDIVNFYFMPDGSRLKVINIKEKYPQIFDWLNLIDLNVWIILFLIISVAGFNMVSSLLILILEKTNMIGILKALGSSNLSIRKIFIYQSAFLISKGLLWGNIFGLLICFIQYKFHLIALDPESYYLDAVPISINAFHILALNIGTLFITVFMLIVPSYIISKISPENTIKYD
ncbi:MAG: ABC transporter permease [Bacteroidales bacterium]|nr:ABC transporter permease [Bacteroidales bacterium]